MATVSWVMSSTSWSAGRERAEPACVDSNLRTRSQPVPSHREMGSTASVTRGHPRARNLQVRFRDDEFDELAAYASQQGLPVSTVVRLLVLKAIAPVDDLNAALDRLESDVAAVRRSALSA